jgi:hypothetical protein
VIRIILKLGEKMKIILRIILFQFFIVIDIWAYNIYDFGTSTGIHETDTSTVFLPSAQNGTARVRVGKGGGGFYLENPGISEFGSGTELKGAASASSSVNKFSIYGFHGGKQLYLKFLVYFSGDSSGKWYFCSGTGKIYSNDAIFRSNQTFCGLRWAYLSGGEIQCEYRKGSTWAKIPGAMNRQNKIYCVELFANNTEDLLQYEKSGSHTVAAFCYDFWVNDTLVGNNLTKSLLADSLTINSFMFYGAYSDSNSAIIYLDDIIYSDSLPAPVATLSHKYYAGHSTKEILLYNNYPNPFNPATNISFKLSYKNPAYSVNIRIYSLQGELVENINLGRLKSGSKRYRWYPKQTTASGEYIVLVQADCFMTSQIITYIK